VYGSLQKAHLSFSPRLTSTPRSAEPAKRSGKKVLSS